MEISGYCDLPFTRVKVTCEGWVSMCCFMKPWGVNDEAYIGNLLHTTFDEIWFGEAAEEVRRDVIDGRLNKRCQKPGCPYAIMDLPYKNKKIIYNEYPLFLEVDLPNTHCNVGGLKPDPVTSPACIMCERSDPKFIPEEDHLFEVLERLKHIVPTLEQIHIQGIAEPFYETKQFGYMLFDVLDALDFDREAAHITLSVTTNGTLLKKTVREEYLRRAPNSITIFSLDASTAETYKKIRILDCFDKVLENLYSLDKERVRGKNHIKIHNNINSLNVGEVLGMVQIAQNCRAECLELSPTEGFNTAIRANEDNCGIFAKAQQDIIDECTRLNVPFHFIRPLDAGITKNLVQLTL